MRILRAFTTNEELFRGFSLELVATETAPRQPYAGLWIQLELSLSTVRYEAEYVPSDALQLTKGGYLRLQGS